MNSGMLSGNPRCASTAGLLILFKADAGGVNKFRWPFGNTDASHIISKSTPEIHHPPSSKCSFIRREYALKSIYSQAGCNHTSSRSSQCIPEQRFEYSTPTNFAAG